MESLDFEYLQSVLFICWKLINNKSELVNSEIEATAWKVATNLIIVLKVLADFETKKIKESKAESKPVPVVNRILEGSKWNNWIKKYISSIEILDSSKQLQRIYFPILEQCKNLKDDAKEAVLFDLKRDSPSEKVEDFLEKSELLAHQIEHQTNITKSKLFWISEYDQVWRYILWLLTITINLLMLIFYKDEPPVVEKRIFSDSSLIVLKK